MSFRWERIGHLFDPAKSSQWMHGFSQNPCPVPMGEFVRVYFNTRPKPDAGGQYVSRISFVDLDSNDPTRLLRVHDRPILPLGARGEFDEFGTMVASCVPGENPSEYWLYYVGWTRMSSVPFNWAIGLARSRDGGRTFERYGRGPLVGPTPEEPFLQACPNVYRNGGSWQMWYVSGIEWRGDPPEPIYRIFAATSDNGIAWRRQGAPVVPPELEGECQTSPTVICDGETLYMFFSYRYGDDFRSPGRGYRMGCATSTDGESWCRRDDLLKIQPAGDGEWDAEMICYPQVEQIGSETYVFYCGNDFGRNGFGAARLVPDRSGAGQPRPFPRP